MCSDSSVSPPPSPQRTHSPEVPTVLAPLGPHTDSHHRSIVQEWWRQEIAPWKALILGRHYAAQYDQMSAESRWLYEKYRYDIHFHYGTDTAPPPQEMWADGILHLGTAAAQHWFFQQEMKEFCDTSSSDDL